MIYGLVLVIHVVLSLFLIGIVLLQGGRGGLGEALGGAAAQSLFGGGANTMMTKITAIGAGFFMVTCLSLAILSTARGRSVIDQLPAIPEQLPLTLPGLPDQLPAVPVGPSQPVEPAVPADASAPPSPAPTEAQNP